MASHLCQITSEQVNGWESVTLSSPALAVTVLPRKGADIYSFVDRATGIDVLGKTPWGLQPPGAARRPGSGSFQFLHNYEGAWQELFPNTFLPSTYEGREVPLHGEVATLPWKLEVECESIEEVRIRLDVTCRQMPLTLTRVMSLTRAAPILTISETVRNLCDRTVQFVWGHHPLLGAPFIEPGCRIVAPRATVVIKDPAEPATATLAPGQRAEWPHALRIDGRQADLSQISDQDGGTHDHAYLTNFAQPWIEVQNPRLRLAFRLEWDVKVFRWLVNWRPLGGSHTAPLQDLYGLALEPWTSDFNLDAAIASGDALRIDPNGEVKTTLQASLYQLSVGNGP